MVALMATRPATMRALALRGRCGFASARLWSPSDLTLFAESPWAAWLERLVREEPSHDLAAARDPPDAFSELLGRKGADAEEAVLIASRRLGHRIIDLSDVGGPLHTRVDATVSAIAEHPDIIYQAPLQGGGFYGVADFLVRVPGRDVEYMVWDAKLGRRARPSQVLQLCCYSEMLALLQPAPPEWAGLVLGGRTPLPLRLASYAALYRHVRGRFLATQAAFDASRLPEPPAPTDNAGRWSGLAAAELEQKDDLRLVAGLGRRQATRLRAAGVPTACALVEIEPGRSVPGISAGVLQRLRRQARLQRQAHHTPDEPPPFEVLPGAARWGGALAALPPPDDADVFFDLEGFPCLSWNRTGRRASAGTEPSPSRRCF
jgi:predicted RecB family nuclease